VLCPTCTKVNDASARSCSFCGALFSATYSASQRAEKSERRRTPGPRVSPVAPTPAPGHKVAPAAPVHKIPTAPVAPAPAVGQKVPTLKGVNPPALTPRSAGRTRTMIGVALPGPGNQGPSTYGPPAAQETPTARSFDPPVGSPRSVLRELLRRHGEEIMTDPRRCSSLLAADYHRQVSYLIAALEERIPQRLVVESSAAPVEIVVLAMAEEFGKKRELPGLSALYAVESWAIALGLLAPPPGEGTGV
jgi:hypothetical protein